MSWVDGQEISVKSHHLKSLGEVEVVEEVEYHLGLITELLVSEDHLMLIEYQPYSVFLVHHYYRRIVSKNKSKIIETSFFNTKFIVHTWRYLIFLSWVWVHLSDWSRQVEVW